jgi:hypothetical protein
MTSCCEHSDSGISIVSCDRDRRKLHDAALARPKSLNGWNEMSLRSHRERPKGGHHVSPGMISASPVAAGGRSPRSVRTRIG